MLNLKLKWNDRAIGLDTKCNDISFISHAHKDHVPSVNLNNVIASKETIHLAGIKGKLFRHNGIKLYDAGHILGARQIKLNIDGHDIVYTGDFRLKKGIMDNGAEIVQTDVLIIDGTFSNPLFKFPEPFDVYDELTKKIKSIKDKNIFIRAYPIGKTQEIVKVLNEYCGVTPVLHKNNALYSQRYNELGLKLDFIPALSDEGKKAMRRGAVIIVPTNMRPFYLKIISLQVFNKRAEVFDVSGWILRYKNRGFLLSDHADYYDIKRYILESNATYVFVVGDEAYLKRDVALSNINIFNIKDIRRVLNL